MQELYTFVTVYLYLMKHLFIVAILISLIPGCIPNSKPDSKADYALADELHIEHTIIDDLRKLTAARFEQLLTITETRFASGGGQIDTITSNAIEFEYARGQSVPLVLQLRDTFRQRGYFIFRSEENFSGEFDKIAVLKSKDQFDILRSKGTSGVNYDISTDSLITWLKDLHQLAPFQITGADRDWLEARFTKQPTDVKAFAKVLRHFCPEIVTQGTGTEEQLANEIRKTNILYLWWD